MSFLRQIGLLAVIVALVGGGYAAYERYATGPAGEGGPRRGGFGPVPVDVQKAGIRRIEELIEAVGTTRARQAVEIVPKASGQIVEMNFTSGQRVEAGEVLARLDDDIQRADLAEAEAKLAEASLARERAETLSRSNAVSRASIDQLTAALATAQAQLDRARRRLEDRTVTAPFAGILGLKRVETGAMVDDKTTVTTLDDLSEVEIEFALPETVFGKVRIGLPVKADSSAFPDRAFTGTVSSIDSRVDTVSRAFKVRAVVPNEDLTLPAGMFMHLAVILDAREGLMISEEAVIAEGGTNTVFVVEDGKARRRPVTIGKREYGAVEIVDGLAEGETVVTRGVQRLRDGAPVAEAGAAPKGPRGPGAGGPGAGRPRGPGGAPPGPNARREGGGPVEARQPAAARGGA